MASGDTLAILKAQSISSVGWEYIGAQWEILNNHPVLSYFHYSFGGVYARWTATMPRHYNHGGITVNVHYCTSGTTGDTDWGVRFVRFAGQNKGALTPAHWPFDPDYDFGTYLDTTVLEGNTIPATAYNVTKVTLVCTDGYKTNYITHGDRYMLMLNRRGTGEYTGDALVLFIELVET